MADKSSFRTCTNHSDRPARWLCAECGRPFCEECIVPTGDKYFCRECLKQMEVEVTSSESVAPDWPELHWDANLVKRMLAFGYDFVLLLPLTSLICWLLDEIFPMGNTVFGSYFFFFLYLGLVCRDLLTAVGSPGKYFTDLYIWNISADRPAGKLESLIRNLFFPVFYFDLLALPVTEHYHRVGDILAGTTVCDRECQVNEAPYIYRLAGIVGLLLVALFSIFVYWYSREISKRIYAQTSIQYNGSGEMDLAGSLDSTLPDIGKFHLDKADNGYILTGEFESAEKYYVARRKIDKIIDEGPYKVVEETGPSVIMHGPENTKFKLKLRLIKTSPGSDPGKKRK